MRIRAKSTLSVFLAVCLLLSSFGSMLAVTLAEQVNYYTYTQDFEDYKLTANGGIGWFRTEAYTMVDKTNNISALTYSGNKAFERQAKSDNHPLIRIIDDSSKTLTVGKNYRAYVYTTATASSKTTFWMGGNTANVVDGSRSKTDAKYVHKAYNPAVPSTEKDYSRGLIYNVGTAGDFNILAGTFTAEKENLYFYNSNTTESYSDDIIISEIIPAEKIQATLGADSTGMGTVKVENKIAEFNTATEKKNYITADVQYAVGETAVYTATATDGYIFDCWKDANGNPVSTSANYEVELDATLSKATVLTAHFKEKTTNFYTYTQDFENYPTTSGWLRVKSGTPVLSISEASAYAGTKSLYKEESSDAHPLANIITDTNNLLSEGKVYRITYQMNLNGKTFASSNYSFWTNSTNNVVTGRTQLINPITGKAARPAKISDNEVNGYNTYATTVTSTNKYLLYYVGTNANTTYADNFVVSEVIPSSMINASVADNSNGMGTVKVENSVAEFNTATNDKNYITAGAQYAVGETAVYTATAAEGYRFVAWKDVEGNTVSTDATYNLVLSDLANIKTDLYAHFEAAPFAADSETEDISKWFLAHKQEIVDEKNKITTGQKNLPGYGTEEVPAEKINCFSKLPEDAKMPWLTVDEDVVKSGNYSLEVRANPGYLYTIFDNLEKDTDYRVSFWYNSPVVYETKTEKRGTMVNFAGIYNPNLETATLSEKTDGYLNLIAYNQAYTTKDGIYSKRRVNTFRTTNNITPEGTTPVAANTWNYMELTFNSADYSELALVICTAVGQNPYTVYIDDVKLEKGGATIKAPVVTDIKEPQDQVSIDFDNRGGDATFQQTDRFEVITDEAFDETQSKMLHIKQGEYKTTTVLNSTNTTNGIDKYFSIPVKPDHQYEITLRAKVGSGLVSDWLSFIAKHGTNSTTIATPMYIEAKDVWRDYRAVVIMGDDEDVLSFTLNGGKKTPEIWIDDIVITDMGVPTMFEGHNGPTDEFVVNFDDFYVPVNQQERMGVLLAPERDGKQTNALRLYQDTYTVTTQFSLTKAARYTDPIFTIPVKPNTLYEYSFWVYLDEEQSKIPYWTFYVNYGDADPDLAKDPNATIEGPDVSKRGTRVVYRVGGFATTGQWVKQSVEFITGPEQYYISTAFDAGAVVKACWLDDITLKEVKPGIIDEISLTYCEDMYNLFTEENVKSVSQGKTQSIKLNLKPNTTYSFGITANSSSATADRVFVSADGKTPLAKSGDQSPEGIIKSNGNGEKRYGYRLATDSSGVLYLVIENNDGSLKLSDPDFFVPASLSCKIPMGYEESPNVPLKQPESIEVVWAKDTLQSTTDVEESEDEEYDDFDDSEEYDDYEDFDDSDEFDDYEDLEETDTQESPDDSDETEETKEKDSSIVIKFIIPAILLVIIIAVAVVLILKFKKGGKHNEK